MISPELNSISIDITNKCNLHCSFCRNSGVQRNEELSYALIIKILNRAFRYNSLRRVHLTGGEPTLHSRFIDLCRTIKLNKNVNLAVSTNGYELSHNLIKELADLGIDSLSISLNGDETTHNRIVGVDNCFQQLRKNVTAINNAKISFVIRTTLTLINFEHFQSIIDFCSKMKSGHLSIRRYIGSDASLSLSSDKYKNSILKIKKSCNQNGVNLLIHDPILFPLFNVAENILEKYKTLKVLSGCSAGITSCHVDSKGNMQPCPGVKITCGDLNSYNFDDIWNNSEVLQSLRRREFEGECGSCKYTFICGGCRASSLIYSNNLLGEDPYCLLRYDN